MELPSIFSILEKLWRRKAWLVVPPVLGLGLAYLAVQRAEPRYKAQAVLYVEPQKIPKSFVEDTVTTNIPQRLQQIELQVKQDDILTEIVRELYPRIDDEPRISEAVREVRNAINVQLDARTRTLKINYSGIYPGHVAHAANLIADSIVEQNSRLREQQTRGTTAFLDEQITLALEKRQQLAEQIALKRRQWDGRLPEQRQGHQRAVEQLERQLQATRADIDNAETRRLLLQRASGAFNEAPVATREESSQLDDLRIQLRRLRARFTDQHPDVIRLQQEIAAIEQSPAEEVVPREAPPQQNDPILATELEVISAELSQLENERVRLAGAIAEYQRKLEVVPEIEQELASLDRQYKNADGLYGSLLKDRTEAELAEKLEVQRQSEQLSILKRAQVPSKPYTPRVKMWLLAGLGLGFALGLGLVFLREELDQTFTDPDSLTEAFPGVSLLSVIPSLDEPVVPTKSSDGQRRQTA